MFNLSLILILILKSFVNMGPDNPSTLYKAYLVIARKL